MTKRLRILHREGGDAPSANPDVRLYVLESGWLKVPRALVYRQAGLALIPPATGWGKGEEAMVWLPVGAYLIVHDGELVVVDTGLHSLCGQDPVASIGRLMASIMRAFRIPEGADLRTQIERLGYAIEQVKYLIITHLHTDHAGGIADFARATILLGRGEWKAAQSVLRFRHGYRHGQFAYPYDYREVPQQPMAPLPPFEAGYDLFNDGTVVIVPTPGHTRGHQSVCVRLRSRLVFLAGDAAFTARSYREQILPGFLPYKRQQLASLQAVKAFSDHHPDALIIPGHDAEQWPTLKKAPDYYD